MRPDRILISPGPCTPQEAGITLDLLKHFAASQAAGGRRVPILGVCLGHQAIGAAFGGQVVRAQKLMHGKTSLVDHDGTNHVFAGLPEPMTCTRYHSLIVNEARLPAELGGLSPHGDARCRGRPHDHGRCGIARCRLKACNFIRRAC